MEDFQADIEAVGGISAVPTILEVVCRSRVLGINGTENRVKATRVLQIPASVQKSSQYRMLMQDTYANKNTREARWSPCFAELRSSAKPKFPVTRFFCPELSRINEVRNLCSIDRVR